MKAVLCKEFGPIENLAVEEIESSKAEAGKVVITVKSCSLNFPDILMVQGKYQFKPAFPFSPGGEVAGIVKEVGEGVKHLKVGQEVFAMTGHGGFAEEVLADAKAVFPLPPGLSFTTASAISTTYGTTYHALKDRAKLKPGETLLVLGAAGGVGISAVELGTVMGAKVIAAASTDEKLELCKKFGAQETINYSKEDLKSRIKELTNGKGVDVVYDPVGGDYAEPAVRGMAWEGRYLVIGFAAGEIPKIPLNLTLLKGCSLVGVFWGRFVGLDPQANMQNFMELIQMIQSGKVNPHIHDEYPLESVVQAMQDMLDRKVMGKVVLVP